MKYIITESQVDTMKKYMFDILDKDSNSWNVEHFKFREMMISDESGDVLFNYSTNNENYGEMSDFLSISPKLIRKVEAFLPLMDEYYISEWFSQKYNRRVDEVMIEDEEMDEFFPESEQQRLDGVINESKFFHRRVNLDDVKWFLPVFSQQVFYETASYEQFKYELTLRAVESVIWNEYQLGWEDLPSEDEIKFVSEVSDMFEDIIKELYKSHS
jgi:hypothetical protein